ncbi:hypothetical protein HDU87_007225 [Geranomyces variabilis]|uniref:Uncharacterized protein n=1 Tax=Geranomyces variabilis TaxID=109894 RepID=A0AAD5TJP8_9FUNG|nr:hypothetical protein HDU87_007225 [Geranomyces variabilis]
MADLQKPQLSPLEFLLQQGLSAPFADYQDYLAADADACRRVLEIAANGGSPLRSDEKTAQRTAFVQAQTKLQLETARAERRRNRAEVAAAPKEFAIAQQQFAIAQQGFAQITSVALSGSHTGNRSQDPPPVAPQGSNSAPSLPVTGSRTPSPPPVARRGSKSAPSLLIKGSRTPTSSPVAPRGSSSGSRSPTSSPVAPRGSNSGSRSPSSSPVAPRGALRGEPALKRQRSATDIDGFEATEDTMLLEIIEGFQAAQASSSLPYFNILLGGAPEELETYAPIFKNRLELEKPSCPLGNFLVEIQQHLAGLPKRGQRDLLTMVSEIYPRRGADGVVEAALLKRYLPATASADNDDLREFIALLHTLEPLPFGELLLQGSERTSDVWVWSPFYKLLLLEPRICVYYGEIHADSTRLERRQFDPKAAGRAEDWIITAEDGGCGTRGKDIGIGDSLGSLDLCHEKAIEKILKSGRSARDMALRNPATPILWLIQSHKWCVVYTVWAKSSEAVIAEYVGHCRSPISASNLALGVAKCANLFMKARTVIRNALQQIDTVAPRGVRKNERKPEPSQPTHLPPQDFKVRPDRRQSCLVLGFGKRRSRTDRRRRRNLARAKT